MKYEIVEAVRHIATTPCMTKEQLVKTSRVIVALMKLIPEPELDLLDPAVLAIYYRAKSTIEEAKVNAEGIDIKFKDFNNPGHPVPPGSCGPFAPKTPEQRAKEEGWPEITKDDMKAAYGDEDEWSEGDIDYPSDDFDDDDDDDDDDESESWKKGPNPDDKE